MTVFRYLLMALLGIAAGIGGAWWYVRSSPVGSDAAIGGWTTGLTYGSAEADPMTRAVVAARGLLALPRAEARYYNAAVDSSGAPLDGRCRYQIAGGPLPAAWWSITLYGDDGFLVANPADRFSISGDAVPKDAAGRWRFIVSPEPLDDLWLPTGARAHFELTLRAYLPVGAGARDFTAPELPTVTRLDCG